MKFVQAYQRAGVPVYALTLQNEPQNRHPNAYPGTDLPVAQEAKLDRRARARRCSARGPAHQDPRLRPQLVRAPRTTSPTTPPGEDPETDYPYDLLRSGRRAAGSPAPRTTATPATRAAQTELHDAFPDKGIWFTECSGSHGPTDPPAQVFSDTLKWHARNLVARRHPQLGQDGRQLEPRARPDRRPAQRRLRHLHRRGHRRPRTAPSPATPSTTRSATWPGSCSPGAVRIASTSFGTTGWNGQIMDVAFRNPDGSTALVVHNENDDPRTLRGRAGRRVVRLHAARRRAGHVHLAGRRARSTTACGCSTGTA